MLKVKEGELDRLGMLFERYHRILLAFFFRQHRDTDLSEDLVQNVFLRILKYRHGFKGEGSFKVWMFHIARNVSNDQYKKSKRLQTEELNEWNEKPDELDETDLKELKDRMLFEGLNALSSEKKELLVLSKLQGMKYTEIADLMETTEGNVKVRVFRALGELKTIMNELRAKV